ncbi:MAG: aspartate kinase [Candidatus Eremiobacteraeota bacterium]|nr:aspartate kinase [Candidatus Eremiobacteraeota bacterium]
MSATLRVAVLKFGGTSVASREMRDTAINRIKEARESGFSVVVVVSAMGRGSDPYSTDALLALGGGAAGTANADLLLSCGELIAAAVLAEELTLRAIAATALSGQQAGIITNGMHGDAAIMRVDPAHVQTLLESDIVPVIAGFQGATSHGAVTTLGRGGTDLTAIAIAHALHAERVDIYTDVDGVMSADPRRIEGASHVSHASFEEMAELAEHGAKVMHRKAAAFAHERDVPYTVKGLASDTGTVVGLVYEPQRPVTGITSTGRLTWVRAIRGDIENPTQRMQTELEMFKRLAEADISIDQVTINQAGVAFAIQGDRANDVRQLLGDLNLAIRVREGCSKLAIVGAGMRGMPGVVHQIVSALSRANVEIIHATDSYITVSVLVPEADVTRAEFAVHEAFHLSGDPP